MIKFLGSSNGRPMLGFGLSRGNCEMLLQNKPIFIDLKVMLCDVPKGVDLNEATVFIFAGETEELMQKELAKHTKLPSRVVPHHEENL